MQEFEMPYQMSVMMTQNINYVPSEKQDKCKVCKKNSRRLLHKM